MKIIYIADDGTQFDNEFKCEDYEWKLKHTNIKDAHAFNKDGIEFEDIFSEDTYNYSTKIIVSSDEAARELQELCNYTGYVCYKSINKAGEWIFDDRQETFVEVTK